MTLRLYVKYKWSFSITLGIISLQRHIKKTYFLLRILTCTIQIRCPFLSAESGNPRSSGKTKFRRFPESAEGNAYRIWILQVLK